MVHKASIAVASAAKDYGADVMHFGTNGTRQCDIAKLLRQLHSKAKRLDFVYEAGPCGSWLSHSLTTKGDDGLVVALSLIPWNAGDRIKRTAEITLTGPANARGSPYTRLCP
jgi:transposase